MAKRVALKNTPLLEKAMEKKRQNYALWRAENRERRLGFYPIYNTFKDSHLAEISGGALKAYIYFGIHSNNKTGECWHSVETIGEFFGVDARTVKKWVSELEERRLIIRYQKGFKRVANTFLLPYGFETTHDETSENNEIQ